MTFKEKYQAAVERNGSILCAGLDPAEYAMGRGGKGLPEGVGKRDWSLMYVEAVAPFASALKPNTNYWEDSGDVETLREIVDLAHSKGLVVIQDSKRRDIGSTNDSGLFYTQKDGYDAVTFTPFAGNLEEAAENAHQRGLGLVSMCIMSNPEFEREKTSWIMADELPEGLVISRDYMDISDDIHLRKYIDLASRSQKAGVDGLVIGAPSKKNHIKDYEVENVSRLFNGLILVPGVGAQGGEVELLKKYFEREALIVNVGRDLMLPNGSRSTFEDQIEAARNFYNLLAA